MRASLVLSFVYRPCPEKIIARSFIFSNREVPGCSIPRSSMTGGPDFFILRRWFRYIEPARSFCAHIICKYNCPPPRFKGVRLTAWVQPSLF